MATVHFTSHLQSFVNSAPVEVAATTVGAALNSALDGKEQLRSYVMDEHGRLRRHIMVFIDGKIIDDRVNLSDSLTDTSEVYVMQALSGG
ncbi:MoaD/ThiS family protein [Bythopirellula polymerisocia]|uniref:ThiS family protein n=1 Tax=Bythopirellula polymerisocia TaxID=2528003 RepID=A0A5C6CEP4_9BACT|nr:MoaD/ThiS family protein [Bythopirellula polymerisocia]TWU21279.1 hypothetical protein Pla144_46880 [Bythopirellula polymerisocia]